MSVISSKNFKPLVVKEIHVFVRFLPGVDFVVEPIPLTPEDQQMISNAIALYKATGKITRAPRPKRKARRSAKTTKK